MVDLSKKLCEINVFVRGKYGPLCCLVDVLSAHTMLDIHPSIPKDIMFVMTDQTVVPHVRAFLFSVVYGIYKEEKKRSPQFKWKEFKQFNKQTYVYTFVLKLSYSAF